MSTEINNESYESILKDIEDTKITDSNEQLLVISDDKKVINKEKKPRAKAKSKVKLIEIVPEVVPEQKQEKEQEKEPEKEPEKQPEKEEFKNELTEILTTLKTLNLKPKAKRIAKTKEKEVKVKEIEEVKEIEKEVEVIEKEVEVIKPKAKRTPKIKDQLKEKKIIETNKITTSAARKAARELLYKELVFNAV